MRAISRVLTGGPQPDVGGARVQQHHDLLERRVPGALADAVDRALDLARPRAHPGEGVRDGEPEVVVAVHRQHDVAQRGHQLVQARQPVAVLVRHRVADRVGDVDRARALLDRHGHHLGGELDVRARRVHRRELDVLDELPCVRDRGAGLAQHVLAGALQLVDDVDVGGGDERVDARARGVADGGARRVDVGEVGAREPRDHRALDRPGDALDGLEIPGRGDREAGLDHVDSQPRELLCDLELLGRVQRDSRRLLAVTQRRIEDQYAVALHDVLSVVLRLLLGWVCGSGGRHALFPPRGEEKKGKQRNVMRHAL